MLLVHFFINATATTEIYTLSLHDALPIFDGADEHVLADLRVGGQLRKTMIQLNKNGFMYVLDRTNCALIRSEEHTSELQSLRHLVCRLLLEKKKKNKKVITSSNKIII